MHRLRLIVPPAFCAHPATPRCSPRSWLATQQRLRDATCSTSARARACWLSWRRSSGRAVAIDLSRRAQLNARLNARLNGLVVTVRRGDLFAPVRGRRFDLIVSNPPYIPAAPGGSPRGRARAWDAGPEGRIFLDRLCAEAPAHLRPGGRILLVHSSLSRPEETERRLAEQNLDAAVVAEHEGELGEIAHERVGYLRSLGVVDGSLRERMVVVEGRAAPAAPLQASTA